MGDVLFAGGTRVMSAPGGGIDARFASLRAFTTDRLAEGQLPLWNPSIYSGVAHVGGFESNLYYPFGLIYRILPLAPAINFGIAIHLFLFAMFTYLWLRRHQLHPIACIYGGVVAMLSGLLFLRATAGDLAIFEAFTWCPAAFFAMHCLSRGQLASGVVGGTLAITMQILCGYPIATLYTGLATFLYGTSLFADQSQRRIILRGMLTVLAVTPFLAAIQLWIGFDTFTQSTRIQGDSAAHISAKAFSAQDIITAFTPWSRSAAQNTNIYVGIVTLLVAVYGLTFGTGRFRFAAATISGTLFAIAILSIYTSHLTDSSPLRYIVEPNLFVIPAMLFVIAIACIGMDRLIRYPKVAIPMAGVAVVLTVMLCAAGLLAYSTSGGTEGTFRGLLMAAGVTLCAATVVSLTPVNAWFRFGVLALGIAELYVFAIANRDSTSFDPSSSPPELSQSDRLLDLDWRNPPPDSETLSASGNTALPSQRYMALLARTQWTALPEYWNGPFEFIGYHPLHRMLRVAYVNPSNGDATGQRIDDHLPRFVLLTDYLVVSDQEEAFATMDQSTFDPWRTVVLEAVPTPIPQGDTEAVGIGISEETTNSLVIELKLESPAILLMTDAYDRGWRASGLTGSSQWQYEVMPANVALRAIPLGAGPHRIQLEYAPLSFRIGQWVSVATAAAFALFGLAAVRRRQRSSNASTPS